jgi:ribosomal-protein-alanine N-acetyltransferase
MVALDDLCFTEPFRFSRASMKSYAQAKNACVVVAEDGEQIAGFCILHVERSRRRDIGYVVTLDVVGAYRRKGLATDLMRAVEQMAMADGCKTLALHVFVENEAAILFYAKFGFVSSHIAEGFYEDAGDALVMHKELAG